MYVYVTIYMYIFIHKYVHMHRYMYASMNVTICILQDILLLNSNLHRFQITLGIMAETGERAVKTLQSWVSNEKFF
jgi:hypothetical protein